MPALLWLSLTAMRSDCTRASCIALSAALTTVAHARLTRLLHADWSGPTLLVWKRAYHIMEATVGPTPFATAIEGLAGGFSRQERTPVAGLSLGWVVWTKGTHRVPLGVCL
jgi:hypothetical protein